MKWLASFFLVVACYVIYGLYLGLNHSSESLARLGWAWWLVCIGAVLVGHGLLWIRWHFSLSMLGYELKPRDSAQVYACGLSLILAPARGGETIRGFWLHRKHCIPVKVGVAITFSERLLDLCAALLILAWGLGLRVLPAVLLSGSLGAAGAWLLTHPKIVQWLDRQLQHRRLPLKSHRLHKVLAEIIGTMSTLRLLIKPLPLLLGALMSVGAWMSESIVLLYIFRALGSDLALTQVASIRTISSIAGVFSLLPAGLGTSEFSSVGMAIVMGANQAQALTATLVIRTCTVLVPFLLGTFVLLRSPSIYRPQASGSGQSRS